MMKLLIIVLTVIIWYIIWRIVVPLSSRKAVVDLNGQYHHTSCPLPNGYDTQGLWAIRSPRRLLVFVHGFKGHATGTWNQFPRLLLRERACEDCDIVFFGYNSLSISVDINAQDLNSFLRDFITSPTTFINPLLHPEAQRLHKVRYENVFIVAHSLGAIVSRRALLNAHITEASWSKNVGLILFAPAHMGANILGLVMEALMGIPFVGGILSTAMRWQYTSLQDVEPDCLTLRQLHEDTRNALRQRNGRCHKARKVIHGSKDRVVNQQRFCDDPPLTPFKDKNHRNVCKPSDDFLGPLTKLMDVLTTSHEFVERWTDRRDIS